MTAPARWTPNPDAAAAKLQAVHARLTVAVAELTRGEAWQQLLQTAARLPHYSPNNVLLITSQCPHARAVAGFGTWKQLGRQVRRGENGIAILAPLTRRDSVDRSGADQPMAGADPAGAATGPGQPADREAAQPPDARPGLSGPRLSGFRVVHVFELGQTEGPDLPTGPVPQLLEGASPAGLYDGLAQQVRCEGFALLRHEFEVPHLGSGRANGVTDYLARTVLVRPELTPAQATKTLTHELGHVLLHRPPTRPDRLDRDRAEIEAESVAYLVTAAHGLAADDYTVPYVAGWSGGDLTLLRQTAERVLGTAQHILEVTPPPAALTRPAPAVADRQLRRTSRTTSRIATGDVSRLVSGDGSRDFGRDRPPVAVSRSALTSRSFAEPATPAGPVRRSRPADQVGLW